jgi:hypothetical protein
VQNNFFPAINLVLHLLINQRYLTKSQKTMFWMLFFLSLALSVAVYFFIPDLVSLMVVPIVTTFAKALDLI